LKLLAISNKPHEALQLRQQRDETDDALIERIVEYAKCCQLIRGAEASNSLALSLKGPEHGAN